MTGGMSLQVPLAANYNLTHDTSLIALRHGIIWRRGLFVMHPKRGFGADIMEGALFFGQCLIISLQDVVKRTLMHHSTSLQVNGLVAHTLHQRLGMRGKHENSR